VALAAFLVGDLPGELRDAFPAGMPDKHCDGHGGVLVEHLVNALDGFFYLGRLMRRLHGRVLLVKY
jgi:hypothetical protein